MDKYGDLSSSTATVRLPSNTFKMRGSISTGTVYVGGGTSGNHYYSQAQILAASAPLTDFVPPDALKDNNDNNCTDVSEL